MNDVFLFVFATTTICLVAFVVMMFYAFPPKPEQLFYVIVSSDYDDQTMYGIMLTIDEIDNIMNFLSKTNCSIYLTAYTDKDEYANEVGRLRNIGINVKL